MFSVRMIIETSSGLVDHLTILAFMSKSFNMLLHVILHGILPRRCLITIETLKGAFSTFVEPFNQEKT